MSVKGNIVWTGLMVVFLVLSVSLTASNWVVCEDVLPDEYMDVSVGTEQNAQQSIFQAVDLLNALLFVSRPDYHLPACFPVYFTPDSLCGKQPLPVILRI
jgi:hypothetical protein